MSINVFSGSKVTAAGVTGARTVSITPHAIGNLLFVVGAYIDSTSTTTSIASVSDSVDGAWTVVQGTSTGNGDGTNSFIAYRANASSTAARTVTITPTSLTNILYWAYSVNEASGVATTSVVDQTSAKGATAAAATITLNSVTNTVAGDLVVAVGGNYDGSAWTSPTTGWTQFWNDVAGATVNAIALYQIDAGTSNFAPVFTVTGGNYFPSAALVSFKAASGGGTNTDITPPVGPTSLTGAASSLVSGFARSPTVSTLVLTGAVPTVLPTVIAPVAAAVTLVSAAPIVTSQTNQTPATASLVLSGTAPTIVVGSVITPTVGSALTVAGAVPTGDLGLNTRTGSAILLGAAPVLPPSFVSLTPSTGEIVAVGYGLGSNSVVASPDTTALIIVGRLGSSVYDTHLIPASGKVCAHGYLANVFSPRPRVANPRTGSLSLSESFPYFPGNISLHDAANASAYLFDRTA